MRYLLPLLTLLAISPLLHAQGTVPVFEHSIAGGSASFVGNDPARDQTTSLPTLLVPITLVFPQGRSGQPVTLDASADAQAVRQSPLFESFAFPSGGSTQYGDALLRSTFPASQSWHTLLAPPQVVPVSITIPPGYGYVLSSRKSGRIFAVVDVEYLQRELFQQIQKQPGKLVIAVTRNTTYFPYGDATICCSWGAHGVDESTGDSFVLGSYLDHAPAIVQERDLQPLAEQLAEFLYDPLHDPLYHGAFASAPGNHFKPWLEPGTDSCAGTGAASNYFQLEPTDTNLKNNFPVSVPFIARGFHLQNVALLHWYDKGGSNAGSYSFPDARALRSAAVACPIAPPQASLYQPRVAAMPPAASPTGHKLIGYWVGKQDSGAIFRLRDVSPQWDIVIVAFDVPVKGAPEGTLAFRPPYNPAEFKADVDSLKSRHKKVMLSLGGGGQFFSLNDARQISTFVRGVEQVVSQYGFDGIDIDFENPSLALDAGDNDFRHPTTPSLVNLITALRQIHNHFGPGFMISLVPEGPQLPAGYEAYGGQFGSYLPLTWALRDILSFVDVQDYNTPPLEGLDGEIYQSHTLDYHAAMTELLLQGFPVGGKRGQLFPGLPPDKVAVGFLVDYDKPQLTFEAIRYLLTGEAPPGTGYRLRRPGGYPTMMGAMFWNIDMDRADDYSYSNLVGPELHPQPH